MDIKEKLLASCLGLSLFDTIGFMNIFYETNLTIDKGPYNSFDYFMLSSYYIIKDFISKGGIKNINLDKLYASDDTILMISTLESLNNNDILKNLLSKHKLLKEQIKFKKNLVEKRYSGIRTLKAMTILNNHKNDNLKDILKNYIFYNDASGGNGSVIRIHPYGFLDEKDIYDKVIDNTLATHTSFNAIIGSLITAFFIRYALDKIPIQKWFEKFFNYYNKNIHNKIKKDIENKINFTEDSNFYEDYDYIYDKLDMYNKKYYKFYDRFYDYQLNQLKFFNINYISEFLQFLPEYEKTGNIANTGASGFGCIIYVYHMLLSAHSTGEFNYQQFFYDTVLHGGDNDSTGAVAGALVGVLYGFKYFDQKQLEKLEFYDEINKKVDLLFKNKKL